MKFVRALLIFGAIANALFFCFHLFLGWRIHHLVKLDPGLRSLIEMLNGGGALLILFLAVASLLVAAEPAGSTGHGVGREPVSAPDGSGGGSGATPGALGDGDLRRPWRGLCRSAGAGSQ